MVTSWALHLLDGWQVFKSKSPQKCSGRPISAGRPEQCVPYATLLREGLKEGSELGQSTHALRFKTITISPRASASITARGLPQRPTQRSKRPLGRAVQLKCADSTPFLGKFFLAPDLRDT